MKITYTRPRNTEEIAKQLRAMQSANDFENISQLIEDIEWLSKEEVSHIDRIADLEIDLEDLERESAGREEYIKELEDTIETLEEGF